MPTQSIKIKCKCVICNYRTTITDQDNIVEQPICPRCLGPMIPVEATAAMRGTKDDDNG